MRSEVVQSKVKCPKCKSQDLFLIEVWKDSTITWEQTNGKFDKADGSMEHGGPYKIEAKCQKCKHVWKIKQATDIGHIILTPTTKQ